MGRLKSAKWIQEEVIPDSKNGEFRREDSGFRDTIEEGGKYPPETFTGVS